MSTEIIKLNNSVTNTLGELYKLINYFHEAMNHTIPADKLNGRVRLALATGVASCEYTESIAILCAQRKSKSCEPLLRSLLESKISLIYILDGTDETRLDKAILANLKNTRKQLSYLQDFFDNSDTDASNNGLMESDEIAKLIRDKDKEIEMLTASIKATTGSKSKESMKLPKLYQRAKQNDKIRKVSPQSSTYLSYLLIYSTLSGAVHMQVDNLAGWFYESEGTLDLNSAETLENAHQNLLLAFALFSDISIHILKELNLDYQKLRIWTQESLAKIETYSP